MDPEFIVEDGSIVENANSYLTVAESNQLMYFDIYRFADWEGRPDAEKEKRLVMATSYLDTAFEFAGRRVSTEQALDWPRRDIYSAEHGGFLPDDAIPKNIKLATIELAIWFTERESSDYSGGDNIDMLRTEDIEMTFDTAQTTSVLPQKVLLLLRSLASFAGGAISCGRIVRK